MHEYPKMLYRGADAAECLNDSVIVQDSSGEEIARADGFAMYAEIAAGDKPLPKTRRREKAE